MSFKVCVSLLIFYLVDLSIGVSGVLKSPTIIVLLLISPFILVSICLTYCGAPMLLLLLSHFSRVRLFVTLWTVSHQAPLSMGFSRQEYWSGLPFPSPGDLPDLGIKPRSPALQADALTSEPPGHRLEQYQTHISDHISTYSPLPALLVILQAC